MKYDPEKHHRRSIRLKEYDYSQNGAYVVTVCTQNKECLFGKIIEGRTVLSFAGEMVKKCWREIPQHYPSVALDEFVVMPNHIHGILRIENHEVRANDDSPLQNSKHLLPQQHRPNGTSKTIGAIIRGFKIGVTKGCRAKASIRDVWQRNFYEHIIRNEDDLKHVREYIVNNPLNWHMDDLFINKP